jgi:hypothetical protein
MFDVHTSRANQAVVASSRGFAEKFCNEMQSETKEKPQRLPI